MIRPDVARVEAEEEVEAEAHLATKSDAARAAEVEVAAAVAAQAAVVKITIVSIAALLGTKAVEARSATGPTLVTPAARSAATIDEEVM